MQWTFLCNIHWNWLCNEINFNLKVFCKLQNFYFTYCWYFLVKISLCNKKLSFKKFLPIFLSTAISFLLGANVHQGTNYDSFNFILFAKLNFISSSSQTFYHIYFAIIAETWRKKYSRKRQFTEISIYGCVVKNED